VLPAAGAGAGAGAACLADGSCCRLEPYTVINVPAELHVCVHQVCCVQHLADGTRMHPFVCWQ
jgi:hypothetical protein